MLNKYRIKIKIHPAVAKWLDENADKVFTNFAKDGSKEFAYDLRKSTIYFIIQSALQRKKVNRPSKILKKMEKHVSIYLFINSFDFYKLGWVISEYCQNRISLLLYEMMMTDL